ncbi:MAG TPA: long-chain fatty acid--CoA ligase [Trebonia sp.]|jgi:fatty-acyl-CoA synthase
MTTPASDIGLGSWPARRARMEPAATALVQGARRLTYQELSQRCARLARALWQRGVDAGDRVAYLGPNDVAVFEALFATAQLGAVFAPLNTRLAPAEIAFMIDDCTPAVLVVGAGLEQAAAAALAAAGHVPRVLYLDAAHGPGYEEAVATCGEELPVAVSVTLDDPALILYTSGTTGRPKGAVLTHGNLTFNTVNQLAHFPLGRDDVALCSAPLFHVLGLGQITLPALFNGAPVLIIPKFDPGLFLSAIADARATVFSLAPTMLQMLCEHPGFDGADLSSVRYVVYGGSPVPERVAGRWLSRGVTMLQGYGMTEAAPGVLMATSHGALARPLSAGVPHFFTDTALRHPGGTVTTGPGQGELLIRGPSVFSRYWNRPEETAAAFDRGWFATGDIVRIDADGWAYIVDRANDMIISGGENIYPAEVEAAITELPQVAEAAVVGVADQRWGEAGLAFVVASAGEAVTEADIRAHLDGRLARYKIPREFRFTSRLPRNAGGKLLRNQLRAQASAPVHPQESILL